MERFFDRAITLFLGLLIVVTLAIVLIALVNTLNRPEPQPIAKPVPPLLTSPKPSEPRPKSPSRPQAEYSNDRQRAVYARLKATCDSWTRHYRRERSELARTNMNVACRDAQTYARRELGRHVAASYAKPPAVVNSGGAHLLEVRSVSEQRSDSQERSESRYCQSLLVQLEQIQDQLRAGYREPKGNRLRERRRELSDRYRERCDYWVY